MTVSSNSSLDIVTSLLVVTYKTVPLAKAHTAVLTPGSNTASFESICSFLTADYALPPFTIRYFLYKMFLCLSSCRNEKGRSTRSFSGCGVVTDETFNYLDDEF